MDWTRAGLAEAPPVYTDTLTFSGDNTGATDVSAAVQSLLNGFSEPTVLQFPAGTFLFNSAIQVPSETVIKGMGADITIFNFNLGGASTHCFSVVGSRNADFNKTIAAASVGDTVFTQTYNPIYNGLQPGDYILSIQDDAHLTPSGSGTKITGQFLRVSGIQGNDIYFEPPLRLDYPAVYNPRFSHLDNPAQFVGFQCFTLSRLDQANSSPEQASNFFFSHALNCWVKGIKSIKCNRAHVDVEYSTHLHISGNYFTEGHDYGGGLAYGVNLIRASSENLIDDNIFKRLRHSMTVHYGANGNVFAYNYSYDTYKTEFGGFITFTNVEDVFLHGRYAYFNLFEGNVVNWIKADNSFGQTGSYNTLFRNRVNSGNNIQITNANSDNQNLLGNEANNFSAGSSGSHFVDFNSWQSASGTLESSLAYAERPDFLSPSEFGAIGYGYFAQNASNPAKDRADAGTFVAVACGENVFRKGQWSFGTPSGNNFQNLDLVVDTGEAVTFTQAVEARSIWLRPGASADFQIQPNLSDSVYFQADTLVGYSQALGDPGQAAVFELLVEEPGWRIISSPVSGATVADLEEDLIINYAAAGNNCNVYRWDPVTAQYQAIANGSQSLDGLALYIFISDVFVKSGRGLRSNGRLPLALRFRGNVRSGSQSGPALGLGSSSHTSGSGAVGWNLIPNPYPSSLDLDQVFASLPPDYQAGAHLWDPQSQSYVLHTTSLLAPGNPAAIAPGQSFFVKLDPGANVNAGLYDFSNSVRTVSKSPVFYKDQTPHLQLSLRSPRGEQKLYLSQAAAGPPQKLNRIFNPRSPIAQWAFSEQQGADTLHWALWQTDSLQSGQLFPLHVLVPENNKYTLTIERNSFPPQWQWYIFDRHAGWVGNLEQSRELSLPPGVHHGRFAILARNAQAEPGGNMGEVVLTAGSLHIAPWANTPGAYQYRVFDLQGRSWAKTPYLSGIENYRQNLPMLPSGLYIVERRSQAGPQVRKFLVP